MAGTGRARREGATKIYRKRRRGQGQERKEWMALFCRAYRHSLCILSSFKPTYTICSCRLVDILVYVHSSERTHANSIIGGGREGGGGRGSIESRKGASAVFNLWGSRDENRFEAVCVFDGTGLLEVCLARDGVTGGRNKWRGGRAKALRRSIVCLLLHPT